MQVRVVKREWFNVSRADEFRIFPIGDVHIGAAGCDEDSLRALVERIAADERSYWIGMGDYCDFVNLSDPRFDVLALASWVRVVDLADLARAQRERFVSLVAPIAGRCLGLLCGNHEQAIQKHYERDVYAEIVAEVKTCAGWPADFNLGLGFSGWVRLAFFWGPDRGGGSCVILVNCHHGFTNARLAGGRALALQRYLWNHEADLVLFGHSHNVGSQREAVECLDRAGRVRLAQRLGVFGGTFLRPVVEGITTYAERGGLPPMGVGHVDVVVKPGDRSVRVVS